MPVRVPQPRIPRLDKEGDAVFSKSTGKQLFTGNAKAGNIRFGEEIQEIGVRIRSLLPGTLNVIATRYATDIGPALLERARSKREAHQKWTDHPERHRGAGAVVAFGVGKSDRTTRRRRSGHGRWPHNLTAVEGLFVTVRRLKESVVLELSHDPQTVYVAANGRKYNYGMVLETGFGGQFAVIGPTMQAMHANFARGLANALATEFRSTGLRGGGQQSQNRPSSGVHTGWGRTIK